MSNQLFVRVADPETKIFTGCHYEDPNYKLKDNETLEAIPDGLRPPYKLVNGNWVGASEEEFDQSFPLPEGLKEANDFAKQKQLSQQQFTASMIKKVATLTVDNTTQAQVNAGVMKEIAMLRVQVARPSASQAQPTTSESTSNSASISTSASAPLSDSLSPLQSTPASVSSSASDPLSASASTSQSASLSASASTSQSTEGVTKNV